MNIFRKVLSVFAVLGLFSGCASNNKEISRYTEPRYNMEEPIKLKVNRVDVISEFTPSFTRPNVEHLFPVSIEKTAKIWASDRLKAQDFSSKNIAEVIIKDASVTETLEPNEKIWSKDRVKYKANIIIEVRIYNPDNMSEASTEVVAWRELTIDADTDITEKEQYWNSMVQKLFDDFNKKMTANIYQHLNMYVINQQLVPTYY